MELDGRSAVIAGGAGGLGGATVRRLVAQRVGAVVLDPDTERSAALAAELGDRVVVVTGDSNDDDAVASAIAAAHSLGIFSIAVSATGIVIRSPRLVSRDGSPMPKETLLANLDLHVVGPFNLARLSAAAFADNEPDADSERGVIVQTASISAFDGTLARGDRVPEAARPARRVRAARRGDHPQPLPQRRGDPPRRRDPALERNGAAAKRDRVSADFDLDATITDLDGEVMSAFVRGRKPS